MSTLHIIRLRGPWKCERVAGGAAAGPQPSGRVRYARRFNLPTNLEPGERVWLVCQGLDGQTELALNGRRLGTLVGPSPPERFDITDRLAPHNTLAIDTERDGDLGPGTFPGDVWLEIGHPESNA